MNPYLQNLSRIEFVVTSACTGRCKHCSEGDHHTSGDSIDGDIAVELICKITEKYSIDSLMTFGGEPLLYPEAVCKIHAAARKMGIPKRQLITNGFFSRDRGKIQHVAHKLVASGVNDILLSVDAFHQEMIPLEPVMAFAKASLDAEISRLRVHPAWLVDKTAENPYNAKTHEILAEFSALGIVASSGNVIFPAGNALKYLSQYFNLDHLPVNPYVESPEDIRAICISPNGDVLSGNIYQTDILKILSDYKSCPDAMG